MRMPEVPAVLESSGLRVDDAHGDRVQLPASKHALAWVRRPAVQIPDAPWRLVRGVAISLNNDSSSPRAADKLTVVDSAVLGIEE
jgi:hypothetical protein